MNNKLNAFTFIELNRSKTTKTYIVFIILLLGLSSCSVTKCRYSNGFKMDLNIARKEKQTETRAKIAEKKQSKSFVKDTAFVKPVFLADMDFKRKHQNSSNQKFENQLLKTQKNANDLTKKTHVNNAKKRIYNDKVNIDKNIQTEKLRPNDTKEEKEFWDKWIGRALTKIGEIIAAIFGVILLIIMYVFINDPVLFFEIIATLPINWGVVLVVIVTLVLIAAIITILGGVSDFFSGIFKGHG